MSLSTTIKTIQDIMRQDAGVDGDRGVVHAAERVLQVLEHAEQAVRAAVGV